MGSTSPVSVDKEDSQTPIITWPKDTETKVVEVTNPCPAGYRLPTEAELDAERQSWSSDNAAGAFASPLKLPLGGYRRYGDGSLAEVGSRAFYWPDTKDGTNSRYLTFHSYFFNCQIELAMQ